MRWSRADCKGFLRPVLTVSKSAAFVTGETLHVDGGARAGHW
jgi:hypothetical protein